MKDTKRVKEKREEEEIQRLREQLARALADYDNLQKRTEKEKGEWTRLVSKNLVIKFLPVYDMILSAQKHLNDPGIAITISTFENILAEEGIEIIRPKVGDQFNEELHEALDVEQTKEDGKEGRVSAVILPGFRFKEGPVIRHAKVNVFKN